MRILLAPMEGLLDASLRDVLTRVGGIDLCVTEFLRVSGSLLPNRSFRSVAPELMANSRTPSGVPVRVQLLGSDPHFMALNARRLAGLQPAAIDLNFGCPARTVNRHQGGAVLLREPERIRQVVEAVRSAVPVHIQVTAKMRLGYEDKSMSVDCAQAIEAGGAEELVVHARTKLEGYRPPAHWDQLAPIAGAVGIPVIANGEIWSLEDYRRCREVSGIDDVMLGRGIVANPALALALKADESGVLPWPNLQGLLHQYFDLVSAQVLPRYQCGRIKQWLNYLRLNYSEAESAFEILRTVKCPDELKRKLFNGFKAAYKEQTSESRSVKCIIP